MYTTICPVDHNKKIYSLRYHLWELPCVRVLILARPFYQSYLHDRQATTKQRIALRRRCKADKHAMGKSWECNLAALLRGPSSPSAITTHGQLLLQMGIDLCLIHLRDCNSISPYPLSNMCILSPSPCKNNLCAVIRSPV